MACSFMSELNFLLSSLNNKLSSSSCPVLVLQIGVSAGTNMNLIPLVLLQYAMGCHC